MRRIYFIENKKTVLVVDDTRTMRMMVKEYLHQDFFVLEAESGEQAIELFKQYDPDAILLDVQMKGMDGYVACEKIRKLSEKGAHIPIMMATVLNDLRSIQKAYDVGATDFAAKPIHFEILPYRIRYMIRTHQNYVELQNSKVKLNNALLEIKQLNLVLEQRVADRTKQLAKTLDQVKIEQLRADSLLNAIFPAAIAEELKINSTVQPKRYENAAILFIDLVGFTAFSEKHMPDEILDKLQEFIKTCEDVSEKYGLQKIKTIGDAYLAVGFSNDSVDVNPVFNCIQCSEEILLSAKKMSVPWEIHAGIDIGSVIGGIVGRRQYSFDIWGDTVNTAARIQQIAKPGGIYLSETAWEKAKTKCEAHSLGKIPMKGKSPIEIFEYIGCLK